MMQNRRSTTLTTITATLFCLSVSAAFAGGPITYQVNEIDPPAMEHDVQGKAFNASEQVIGQDLLDDWYGAAMRYSDGKMIDLHPAGPYTISQAYDINASGHVAIVGSVPPPGDGAYTSHVFKFTDSAGLVNLDIQSMGGPFAQQGAQVQELQINAAGDLAGDWYAGIFGGGDRAFVHTSESGWLDIGTILPNNPEGESHFIDVNQQRDILVRKFFPSEFFLYSADDGSVTPLKELDAVNAHAEAMNDAGQIVGYADLGHGTTAFRYSPGVGVEALDPTHSLGYSFAKLITESGHVAGNTYDDFFLWTEESGMQLLNITSLMKDANPFQLTAINDHGEIAGTFTFGTYQMETFYWSPETGPMFVQNLVDPDADDYDSATIVDIADDGRLLINARRISDDTLVTLLLTPEVEVEGDITGDGMVGTEDLLALLSAWGPCSDCVEDLDGSGFVDVADLLTLLGNWGS